MAKRRQNDNYRFFAPKIRQNDKTTKRKVEKMTKLGRKDDKHNKLISDLICRLFAWRFDVLSSFRLEKTTERQNDKCRLFAPRRRQNKNTTKRKADKTTKRQAKSRQIHYTTR
jgi:hypothetical protein